MVAAEEKLPELVKEVSTGLHIHYGCGMTAPASWQNFDVSPSLKLKKIPFASRLAGGADFPDNVTYGNIVEGLPVANGSADAVYCSHVLEHLARNDVDIALANTFKMLKPGGVFRLVVPDLTWRMKAFSDAQASGDADAADTFFNSCYMGQKALPTGVMGRVRYVMGNSAHRWMYDYAAMAKLLEQAGFTAIRRAKFGDSELSCFDDVEKEDRFYEDGQEELAIQAQKPSA